MRKAKRFYVYLMTNRPRSHVLYTGITGNLQQIDLIESMNPYWYDLAKHWVEVYKPESAGRSSPDPSPRW